MATISAPIKRYASLIGLLSERFGSQEALAQRLGVTGQCISKWRHGRIKAIPEMDLAHEVGVMCGFQSLDEFRSYLYSGEEKKYEMSPGDRLTYLTAEIDSLSQNDRMHLLARLANGLLESDS